jgi:hypothetical protein
MSFFDSVRQRSIKLERLLEENYQASGKGLGEKARSVEHKLDTDINKRLRFIVAVRNKLMHEYDYRYDGSEAEFLKTCDEVIARLSRLRTRTSSTGRPQVSKAVEKRDVPTPIEHKSYNAAKPPPAKFEYERAKPTVTSDKKAARKSDLYQGGLGKLFSSTFAAFIVGVILYPIVGIAGCIVRVPTQGSPPSPFSAEHDKWLNNPPLNSFSTEAIYIPLFIVIVVFTLKLVGLFKLNQALRVLLIILGLITFGYVGKTTVDSMNLRDKLARTFNVDKESAPPGGSRETPKAKSVIKADKVTSGRTADEKVHEFVLPPNQWVETSLLINPNQEVLVHHFASNESVTVNLGGTTFPTLQKAGTLIPIYTSVDCSRDGGVKAKVTYFCVQLNQSESIKLYAQKSVRVGVVVKNR